MFERVRGEKLSDDGLLLGESGRCRPGWCLRRLLGMGLAAWRQYLLPQAPMTIEEPLVLKILTVNTHKGFTVFNRRFILHEFREAIHATHAALVFLQEVLVDHHLHAPPLAPSPPTPQYKFL